MQPASKSPCGCWPRSLRISVDLYMGEDLHLSVWLYLTVSGSTMRGGEMNSVPLHWWNEMGWYGDHVDPLEAKRRSRGLGTNGTWGELITTVFVVICLSCLSLYRAPLETCCRISTPIRYYTAKAHSSNESQGIYMGTTELVPWGALVVRLKRVSSSEFSKVELRCMTYILFLRRLNINWAPRVVFSV